ncbi:AraC family transcriptional regulator [Mycobacterium xenopi]|uniref:Transcriptional regulator n=2 Tax=Mycobacterium xenopi TaxID=1789 RepID=A0AAD1GWS1_MYCXE|nr:AraC family transcriptional regulator [Mycobacterium xenopi]ORX13438.1 AraC family transcriptional regulator [Mycobacterium xenopi]BBU20758.1 transcriptional regulator [Mycobacterium xenopi]SPX79337.1 helix-turn-helix domain-containing protein [Mycobacterium xenopi]
MSRLTRLRFIDTRRTGNPVRRKIRSRGVPPALTDHEIFYTENINEASTLIGKVLAPMRIACTANPSGFAATMHGVRLRNVSMLYLDLSVRATLEIPALGRYFGVHMPTNGLARCHHNGHEFEANTVCALVTSPKTALTMHLEDDSPQLLIRIEEQALVDYLTRLRGRRLSRPLVFHPEFDLTSDVAMRWHAAVQLLHTEVYQPGSLVQSGQGISGIEELLMNSLLHVQPSNYHEELVRPARQPGRRVVQRAIEYIDAHLAEPLTMGLIARNVHMSIRSIQQGFRDELGVSPMTYVRDRRLERVHDELADAMPGDGVTVTDVATRWGFHHLGSFAVEYRKRWGVSPSETLRQ